MEHNKLILLLVAAQWQLPGAGKKRKQFHHRFCVQAGTTLNGDLYKSSLMTFQVLLQKKSLAVCNLVSITIVKLISATQLWLPLHCFSEKKRKKNWKSIYNRVNKNIMFKYLSGIKCFQFDCELLQTRRRCSTNCSRNAFRWRIFGFLRISANKKRNKKLYYNKIWSLNEKSFRFLLKRRSSFAMNIKELCSWTFIWWDDFGF